MSSSTSIAHLPRLLILDADDSYTHNILSLILSVFPLNSPQRASVEKRVMVIRVGHFDWSASLIIYKSYNAVNGPNHRLTLWNPNLHHTGKPLPLKSFLISTV